MCVGYMQILCYFIQAHLGDIMGLVPDHQSKMNMAIKRVTWIFLFPSAYKSDCYTIL